MIELSAQDASFLALDRPNSPWNGGIVLVYDRPEGAAGMGFQDVIDHFQQRLHLVDVLRLKLLRVPGNLARPFWVEDQNLDLEYHMRNLALPPPGDWQQFCLQVARLIARPLDMTRPLWELYMIEGLDAIEQFSKGSFALVLKVHHAALDGRAFLAIMGVLHSLDPKAPPPPPPTQAQEFEPEPSAVGMLLRAGLKAVQTPMEASRSLSEAWPALRQVALPGLWRGLRGGDDEKKKPSVGTPETRFNGPVSPHRSWGACFLNLAETKAIRAAVEGATVHDIAVTVFGGALRTYLGERGELPSTPIVAAIVRDVRGAGDHAALGNQLSAMFASMSTDIEDPLERLAAVRATTAVGKGTTSKGGARKMANLLELMPEAIISPALQLVMTAGNRSGRGLFARFNTAVTGMAGPPKPLYLGATQLTHVIGFGPLADGLGLINIQMSYNGVFVLTFTADRAAMPDPRRYEECIYQAFEALRQAAQLQLTAQGAKATKKAKTVKPTAATGATRSPATAKRGQLIPTPKAAKTSTATKVTRAVKTSKPTGEPKVRQRVAASKSSSAKAQKGARS